MAKKVTLMIQTPPARHRFGLHPTVRRLVLRMAGALLLVATAGCPSNDPFLIPAPPSNARPAQIPADLGSERLDLVIDEVRHALRLAFGPLDSAAYRLPLTTGWDDVQRHYAGALPARFAPWPKAYREGRRHRLAVWSAGGDDAPPALAVAFIDTPVSGEPATHRVLVVLHTTER